MRIQLRSLIAAFIAVSICGGSIGCKSNGGNWYKPSSYSFHNPFKKDINHEDEFGLLADESSGTFPKDGQTPDLDIPPGGYSGAKSNTSTAVASTSSNTSQGGISRTGTPSSYGGTSSSMSQPSVAMNQTSSSYSPVYPSSGSTASSVGTAQPGAVMQNPNANYAGQYQQTSASNQYPSQYNSNQGNTSQYNNSTYNNTGQTGYGTGQTGATTQQYPGTNYAPQTQQNAYPANQQQYSAAQQQPYPAQTYTGQYDQYVAQQNATANTNYNGVNSATQTQTQPTSNYSQNNSYDYRPGSY